MSKDLKELRNKRGKLVADARTLLDRAEIDKRDLTAEEQKQWDTMIADQERIGKDIEREERQLELDRKMAEDAARNKEDKREDRKDERKTPRGSEEYRSAFFRAMVSGVHNLNGDEMRALQSGSDTGGGFLVMPEQSVDDLIKAVDNLVFIRQKATKYRVPQADSLGVPTLDADPADADWTTELATGNEDSTMAFGKRKLEPHPFAKRIKISNELLRKVPGTESLVRARLAYKFGVTEEKGFMTGTGAAQPLGVFTASASGISTGRDVSTGNTTTEPTFDGLIEAKYTLKGAYWNRADWLFHRDALKKLAKIKDGDGQYIWRESVRAGEPDTLLGRPFMMSEYAPNTFTTGLYVGILGDFSNYWIADALDIQLQRLVELYAETNQVGLIGRAAADGMPVLEEAFVRVKLA